MSEYPKQYPNEYPNQYQQPAMVPMSQKTNTMAIVGFVLSFIFSIAGLIVSIIAMNQIKQTGEGGRGLALAGVIISAISIAFAIIYLIVVFAVIIPAASQYSSTTSSFILGF